MSCHKIMNRIDKVNRNLLAIFTKLQNVRIRHTLWNLMSTTLYVNITAQNLLSWKIVGDAEFQGRGWADFEACHRRTTQAFPCAASVKTTAECGLDWGPHRAWHGPSLTSVCFGFPQAECNSDLHQFFEFLYNHGIGTQAAPLYVAWAGHLEGQGERQHASAVFRRGIQNQAEPRELLQQQYRWFDSETPPSDAYLERQRFAL